MLFHAMRLLLMIITIIAGLSTLIFAQDGGDSTAAKAERERRYLQMKGAETEVIFIGKVVDDNGNPVPSAIVTVDVPEQLTWNSGVPRIAKVATNKKGEFKVDKDTYHITQLRGSRLVIQNIAKQGYEWKYIGKESDKIDFSYAAYYGPVYVPNPAAPTVFNVRKLGSPAFLLQVPSERVTLKLPSAAKIIKIFRNESSLYPDTEARFPGFTVSCGV